MSEPDTVITVAIPTCACGGRMTLQDTRSEGDLEVLRYACEWSDCGTVDGVSG